MASGLPVVSTFAAAIPEVVPHRQAGILVPPQDITTLGKAIVELLENPSLRSQYREFGRSHVQQFTWEQVADQFLAAIQSELTHPAPSA